MSNDARSVATFEWEEGSQGLAARAGRVSGMWIVTATACDCDCDRGGKVMYCGRQLARGAGYTVMPKSRSRDRSENNNRGVYCWEKLIATRADQIRSDQI